MASNKRRDIRNRFKGRGTYPHQPAFILLNPLPSLIFSRREPAARLDLSADSRVLELGPGPGRWGGGSV